MEIHNTIEPFVNDTVTALGYFDGVHLGHRAVIGSAIAEAARRGVQSSVLSFDMSARRAQGKGTLDLMPMSERKRFIANLGVDEYLLLDFDKIGDMDCDEFVCNILGDGCLHAQAVCCGADFRFGRARAGDVDRLRELCYEIGIDVIVVGEIELDGKAVSTTRIKEAVVNGDVEAAEEMLGHPYGFILPVTHGKKLAGKLGFPTINQAFPSDVMTPRFGVYASQSVVGGRVYDAITNVGVRPTVRDDGAVALETHIFDFKGDLYEADIETRLKRFVRDERRFESDVQLKAQVLADIESVRRVPEL
ncbi:MAG: riboflavin biosynthesis protein RibF [Oscillospiraceae bacterium]